MSSSTKFLARPPVAGEQTLAQHAGKRQAKSDLLRFAQAAVELLIARPDVSFRLVSSDAMERFVQAVTQNDMLTWPGRTYIVKTLDETFVERELHWKLTLQSMAKNDIGADIKVACTADGWANLSKSSFCSVTGSLIIKVGGKWVMLNLLLDLVAFKHPHTAARYRDLMKEAVLKWGVKAGVWCTDGATVMIKALEADARFYCMGHGFTVMFSHIKHVPKPATVMVSAAVVKKKKATKRSKQADAEDKARLQADAEAAAKAAKDALEKSFEDADREKAAKNLSATGKILRACGTLANVLTIGGARVQYLRNTALRVQPSGPHSLVPVYTARWWHEILAITRAMEMRPTLLKLDFNDREGYSFSRVSMRDAASTLRDRVCNIYMPALTKIMPLYQRCADWTALLSSRTFPTVGLVLYCIMDLQGCVDYHYEKLVRAEKPQGVAQPLEELLMEEFRAGFGRAYDLAEFKGCDYLRWAAVLDPRVVLFFGAEAVGWVEEIFVYAENFVSGWLVASDLAEPVQPAMEVDVAPANAFAAALGQGHGGAAARAAPRGLSPWRSEKSVYMGHLARLDMETCLKIDPFSWWEGIEGTCPRLARAAQALLSTQATSVFSESVFNVAGMVWSERRCNLTGEHGKRLVLLNNWAGAEQTINGTRKAPPELPKLWTELKASDMINLRGVIDLDEIIAEAQAELDAAGEAARKKARDEGGEQFDDAEDTIENAIDEEMDRAIVE